MKTLDLAEAAQLLKLHPQTVLQRAHAGDIPAAKPGKCRVFIEEDLLNWLRSHYNSGRDARQGGHALYSLKEKALNSGGSNSLHQTAKLYDNLLGLKTSAKHKN
ncbi:MAG: helix-turn-helix domain-containing protein [Methylomicrobium sp.]|nr:helix-turn-helix domain-containing protein [Methylomicrobium sp.]